MFAKKLFTATGGVNRCVAGLSPQHNVSRGGSQIPSVIARHKKHQTHSVDSSLPSEAVVSADPRTGGDPIEVDA